MSLISYPPLAHHLAEDMLHARTALPDESLLDIATAAASPDCHTSPATPPLHPPDLLHHGQRPAVELRPEGVVALLPLRHHLAAQHALVALPQHLAQPLMYRAVRLQLKGLVIDARLEGALRQGLLGLLLKLALPAAREAAAASW
jgi:hypothetical protein